VRGLGTDSSVLDIMRLFSFPAWGYLFLSGAELSTPYHAVRTPPLSVNVSQKSPKELSAFRHDDTWNRIRKVGGASRL
jgi:hypothetical protein